MPAILMQFLYLAPLVDEIGSIALLVNGSSPSSLDWKEYGFKLSIPEHSLQQGDTCTITITAIAQGPFSLPCNSELVGGIYNIELSCAALLKPATIEMEHSVNNTKESPLHFAKASHKPRTRCVDHYSTSSHQLETSCSYLYIFERLHQTRRLLHSWIWKDCSSRLFLLYYIII